MCKAKGLSIFIRWEREGDRVSSSLQVVKRMEFSINLACMNGQLVR